MVHINHLEVRMEVEGDDDERTFTRLFDKYIRRWDRYASQEKTRRRRIDDEARLDAAAGDSDEEGS